MARAYAHRDATYDIPITANWVDPADAKRGIASVREPFAVLQPHLLDMVYMNVLDRADGGGGCARPMARTTRAWPR